MFKKMLNKKSKKSGFTLIELIIVIAIIAILAAIAVPAFGQIRQKANASADLGNARTIYSLVATELASDSITLPTTGSGYYLLNAVGESTGEMNIEAQIEPTPVVKQVQNAVFVVELTADGNIKVGYETIASGGTPSAGYTEVYPAN